MFFLEITWILNDDQKMCIRMNYSIPMQTFEALWNKCVAFWTHWNKSITKNLPKKTPHLSRWRRPSSRFWLWERLPSQHAGKQLRCSTWEFTNGIFCGIFWIRSVGKIGHTFQHIPSDINIFQIHPCELFKSSHCFKNTAPNSFFLLNSVIKKFSESLI